MMSCAMMRPTHIRPASEREAPSGWWRSHTDPYGRCCPKRWFDRPCREGAPMSDRRASISQPSAPTKSVTPSTAARTKLLLEGPILPTLLRLAAPNVLNLLAFAGVITFDGFFLGRIGTNALAGASLAFPWVMMVLQTTNSGMGAGVSS